MQHNYVKYFTELDLQNISRLGRADGTVLAIYWSGYTNITTYIPLDNWAIKKNQTQQRTDSKKKEIQAKGPASYQAKKQQHTAKMNVQRSAEKREAGALCWYLRAWKTHLVLPRDVHYLAMCLSPVLGRNIFRKCLPMFKLASSRTKILLHLNSSCGDDLHEHKQVLKPAKGKAHKSTCRTEAGMLGLRFPKSPCLFIYTSYFNLWGIN